MNKVFMQRVYCVLLIVLVLALTGCKARTQTANQVVPEQVYQGTKGLEMKFMQNLPPLRLYDTGSIDIVAELENKGTSDLVPGRCMLHLSGYDESLIRGIQNEKYCGENLYGKSPGFPEGGYDVAEFHTDLIALPKGIDKFPLTFILTACYEYETEANPIICIDPNMYGIRPIKEACIVSDVAMSGGQGAPVAVSRVGVQMVGKNKVAFEIQVSNVGGGTVLMPGTGISGATLHSCPFKLQYEDYNVIDYQIDMDNGFMIKCSPERLRLVNDQGKIFCTFNAPGEYARTTPLRIKLFYNYMQNIKQNVELIKTPG